MSGTKLLKDKFKDAPAVTSLASADRLIAVNADGEPKRISRINVATPTLSAGYIESPQWVRIGSFNDSTAALLSIYAPWNQNPGANVLVNVLLHTHSLSFCKANVLSVLNHSGATPTFSKMRAVIKSNAVCYLDVYYYPSTRNTFSVSLIAGHNFSMFDVMQFNAEIPDGYTVKEFSLATVGGG